MTGETVKQNETRLLRIERGAYWMGILGRLTIFLGLLGMSAGLVLVFSGAGSEPLYSRGLQGLAGGLGQVITGILFLVGRDALEAILFLFKEMEGIV